MSGWALMRTSDFWWMWAFLGLCSGVGLMCTCDQERLTLVMRLFVAAHEPTELIRHVLCRHQ